MNNNSDSHKISPEDQKKLYKIWKDPWKIPTLKQLREQEELGKNFTNQSDDTILAGIEVVTEFPGFHKFLVGTGEYGGLDFDIPGMCIYMDIPNYMKHCYEINHLNEVENLYKYIDDKLILTQKDTSYNHLRFSFSDSTAFDDIDFRKKFLINMKEGELKNYLMKRFDATYGSL